MESLSWAIGFFQYFGITPDTIAPLVIVGFVLYVFLKKPLKSIHHSLTHLKTESTSINNAVCELQHHITERHGKSWIHRLETRSGNWSVSKSPLALNKEGKGLLQASGIDTIIQENLNELLDDLTDIAPETAYDVQNESFVVLSDFLNDNNEILKQLKSYLFNNPRYNETLLELNDLIYVGGLVLRNEYLKKHPELK